LVPVEQGGDGIEETGLRYEMVGYSNRDVSVSCNVGVGDRYEGGDSSYYPSVLQGAVLASCISGTAIPYTPATTDLSNAGFWQFSAPETGFEAEYVDDLHPIDGYLHMFQATECNSYKLTADDEWQRVDLSAILD